MFRHYAILIRACDVTARPLPLTRFPPDHQVTYRALRVTTTWRPTGLTVARHTHDLTSLAFCVEGPFEETFGHAWRHVGVRSLLIRPGGEPHANRYPARRLSRTLIVELLPQALNEIRSETQVVDSPSHLESERFALLSRQLDLESRNPDTVLSLAIEAHVYDLLVSITRRGRAWNRGEPKWLVRVRDCLHSTFTRTNSLSDLASIAGVHPSHLAKAFRRIHGSTIGEYVRHLRVEHAATLLKQQRLSLAEIALACGFHDQSHFTRVFANVFGMPPGRYASLISRR
jgi:AraC family transcriptional regulator